MRITALISLLFSLVAVWLVMTSTASVTSLALADEPVITTTTSTGYSIAVAPVGAAGSTTPAGAQYVVWRSSPWLATSTDPGDRTEIWQAAGGMATLAEMKAAAPSLLPRVLEEIQAIRRQALSQAVANAGVAAVYAQNYEAAMAYQDGDGMTTVMQNGMTATQYLQGFATAIGLPLETYVAYIISEYQALAPLAYAVEQEYLRLTYQTAPGATDLVALLAIPAQYRAMCGL